VEDEQLLERAKGWRNGAKTTDLCNGVWQVLFPSQSEADQSLCDTFAFLYQKDPARIDRMFRRSGLMRDKWDESHRGDGATYGELTIAKASLAPGRPTSPVVRRAAVESRAPSCRVPPA
jgi:primase-polymerase (primpol)-like protein